MIASMSEQGKLTDELHAQLLSAETKSRLEDVYLPFKPKKKTKASEARDKGLEPLALRIWNRDETLTDLALEGQQAPPPLAAFARPGAVVTVGSLSKSVWAGIRTGWVRGESPFLAKVASAMSREHGSLSIVDQLAACALLDGLDGLTPGNRRFAIEALARDDDRRAALLDALEGRRIKPTEVPDAVVRLLADPARNRSHARARAVLGR